MSPRRDGPRFISNSYAFNLQIAKQGLMSTLGSANR
jgi:hypothetical protein